MGKVNAKARVESELEVMLALQLRGAKIKCTRWHQPLLPERKFEYDFLIDSECGYEDQPPLLVECDGGVWMKGNSGHSSGRGITRDIEKLNLATLKGYRLLRFTREMIESGEALKMIEEAIGR